MSADDILSMLTVGLIGVAVLVVVLVLLLATVDAGDDEHPRGERNHV